MVRLWRPGLFGIIGSANEEATVALWGPLCTHGHTIRQGDHFYGELPVDNASKPVWLNSTNTAFMQVGNNEIYTNTTGRVLIPPAPQNSTHDYDGNLTADGLWTCSWDAENRLKSMESVSTLPAEARRRLVFQYDYQGRRMEKIVYTNNAGVYVASYTNRFIYDGWNLVAVLKPDLTPLLCLTWGNDLSGSIQGAGGVRGLLAVTDSAQGAHFTAFDGNGNVADLVSADGTISCRYEYGPFGEVIRATGPMSKANPFRFTFGSEVIWYEFTAEQIVYSSGKTFKGGLFRGSCECEKEDPVAKKGPHTERVTGGKVLPEPSYQYENTAWPVEL